MNWTVRMLLLFLICAILTIPVKAQQNDFTSLNDFVRYGTVEYQSIANAPDYLAKIEHLKTFDTGLLNPIDELVFWVNAFNLSVIKAVIDNYPFRSIDDLQGGGLLIGRLLSKNFFRDYKLNIGGKYYSPNQIINCCLSKANNPNLIFGMLHPTSGFFPVNVLFFDELESMNQHLEDTALEIIGGGRSIVIEIVSRQVLLPDFIRDFDRVLPSGKQDLIVYFLTKADDSWTRVYQQQGVLLSNNIRNPNSYKITASEWKIRYRKTNWRLNDR